MVGGHFLLGVMIAGLAELPVLLLFLVVVLALMTFKPSFEPYLGFSELVLKMEIIILDYGGKMIRLLSEVSGTFQLSGATFDLHFGT